MKRDEEAHIQSRGYEKGKAFELQTLIKKMSLKFRIKELYNIILKRAQCRNTDGLLFVTVLSGDSNKLILRCNTSFEQENINVCVFLLFVTMFFTFGDHQYFSSSYYLRQMLLVACAGFCLISPHITDVFCGDIRVEGKTLGEKKNPLG